MEKKLFREAYEVLNQLQTLDFQIAVIYKITSFAEKFYFQNNTTIMHASRRLFSSAI